MHNLVKAILRSVTDFQGTPCNEPCVVNRKNYAVKYRTILIVKGAVYKDIVLVLCRHNNNSSYRLLDTVLFLRTNLTALLIRDIPSRLRFPETLISLRAVLIVAAFLILFVSRSVMYFPSL